LLPSIYVKTCRDGREVSHFLRQLIRAATLETHNRHRLFSEEPNLYLTRP
jgi:hypothetical protein